MDFFTFIDNNWTASTEVKLEFLKDFCTVHGYDGDDRQAFVNAMITRMIVRPINLYRKKLAEKQLPVIQQPEAEYDELVFD